MSSTLKLLTLMLSARVNIGSLVAFRVMFGLLSAIELTRYVLLGWVDKYFSPNQLHFSYFGFNWIIPAPGIGVHLIFMTTALCAVCVAVGWCYRFTSVLFSILFAYIFLIDKANYQNHFYLILILSILMVLLPAHLAYSYDAKRRPIIASDTVPRWCLWLLRFQFAIIFLFTGVARIDWHWILRGGQMPSWFGQLLEAVFHYQGHDHLGLLMPLYLCLIVSDFLTFAGLLWRITRIPTVILIIAINLLRACFFDLGVQPWLLIASATLFLSPQWPHFYRRLWPAYDDRLLPHIFQRRSRTRQLIIACAVFAYIGFQLTLPLRHLADPTELDWAQESSRFSWGLLPKNRFGDVKIFVVSNLYAHKTKIDLKQFLTEHQIRTMRVWPDLVHDFAFILRRYYKAQGHKSVAVYASVSFSQDGRTYRLLTNPDINVLAYPRSILGYQPWVVKNPVFYEKRRTF